MLLAELQEKYPDLIEEAKKCKKEEELKSLVKSRTDLKDKIKLNNSELNAISGGGKYLDSIMMGVALLAGVGSLVNYTKGKILDNKIKKEKENYLKCYEKNFKKFSKACDSIYRKDYGIDINEELAQGERSTEE